MKLYDQTDFEINKKAKQRAAARALMMAAPFFLIAVAAFIIRIELLCIAALIAAGAVLIFLYDLRIKPKICYGRYLTEIHSGLSRQTVGAWVRIGSDPVYQDGVNFYEVILNVYEDLDPEGERRFLLDAKKEIPRDWLNRDVIATSHGSFLLGMEPARKTA